MNPTAKDQFFMKQALILARKGMSWTNPQPMVGAVIIKGDRIIAQGYHHRFGDEHAEANALNNALANVPATTMYVTLEPCHLPYDLHGIRIPCSEYIRRSGIRKVHIAMLDPNPQVSGQGKALLEKAGITTTLGCMAPAALRLNETYHHFMTTGNPFVAITFSASLNGKIATRTGDSKWITNEPARTYARKLRSYYQAVLVGINTVLKDDPHLGTRIKGKKDPLRIILDSTLKIPLTSQVLRDPNVLIATTVSSSHPQYRRLQRAGYQLLSFPGKQVLLPSLLAELAHRHIISILVEGGSQVLGSFIDAKLVDKVYAFHAPLIIGGQGITTIAQAPRLTRLTTRTFATDHLTIGYPQFRL